MLGQYQVDEGAQIGNIDDAVIINVGANITAAVTAQDAVNHCTDIADAYITIVVHVTRIITVLVE